MAQTPPWRALTILTAAVIAAGCAPQAQPLIDPQAEAVLTAMGKALSEAGSLKFRVVGAMDEPLADGQLVTVARGSRVAMRRGDRLRVTTVGDMSREAWFDGKRLTVLDPGRNVYGVLEWDGGVEGLMDHLVESYGLTFPAADLLFDRPDVVLTANVETGAYVGKAERGGVDCHHLAFTQETIDWQIWIDAGEQPTPRAMLIRYKLEPGQPQYLAAMTDWDLAADLADEEFTFTPPAGAAKTALADVLGVEEEQGQGE